MNQNRTTLHISVANRRGAPATRFTIDERGRIRYASAQPPSNQEPRASEPESVLSHFGSQVSSAA